jgi:hypothetical protein
VSSSKSQLTTEYPAGGAMWYTLCGVPKQHGWLLQVIAQCALVVVLAMGTAAFRIASGPGHSGGSCESAKIAKSKKAT